MRGIKRAATMGKRMVIVSQGKFVMSIEYSVSVNLSIKRGLLEDTGIND
jgi:ABC-type uncharacterized transport system ATPase component